MRTKTHVLNDEICCWIYTLNPSERHRPKATRVRSETSDMCIAIARLEWREFVPTSSGVNPSLAAPTRMRTALMTAMMLESLTEWRPWGVE